MRKRDYHLGQKIMAMWTIDEDKGAYGLKNKKGAFGRRKKKKEMVRFWDEEKEKNEGKREQEVDEIIK